MAGLTIFVFAGLFGCALAAPAPAPEPCLHPGGYTPNTLQAFFYSMEMYQSYSWSYYEKEMCMAYNINIPSYIPTLWYDEFERMVLQSKCDYINSYNSMYPINYTPNLWDMTVDQLTLDFLVIGGSPGTLSLMIYLIEMGYTVGVIDTGLLAPPQVYSPYYSPSLLGSPYMNRIPAYIPGVQQPRHFYTSNIFGGIQMIESNQWWHGGQSFYQQMSQYSSYFDYSNVISRFSSFEYCQTTTYESSTSFSSNGFGMSYYTYSKETTVTTSIQGWYGDLGYDNFSPFDDMYSPGLYTMPTIGSNDMYSLYIDEIFSRISSFDNIFLFLGVQIQRLIYEMGIIIGVEVITPYGLKIIYVRFDVFFGSNTIDMFKILTRSGIGNPLYMNQFGISPLVELQALGTGMRFNPTYVNPFILMPKFSLVSADINDYTALSFMFSNQNYMSSFDSLYNYRAFTSVGGSSYSNAMYQFFAFNCLMMNRLEYIFSYQFQFSFEQIEYIRTLLVNYDILFITTTLLETSSVGYLEFGETIEDVIIQTQMYSSQIDVSYMTEAILYLQQIFGTSSFINSGAQIRYLSSMGSTSYNFFDTNTIQSTLSMYSFLNFQSSGGAIMGNSMINSVVNNNFNFYNVGNLFALNSAISPYSVPYNNLAFNTLLGSFTYDIIQERISSNFYEYMRSAEFYSNMMNSNIGGNIGGINTMGMNTRGLNTLGTNTLGTNTLGVNGINTMGVNGINTMGGMNTVGMNTMGLNNMGGLNTMGESIYETESMMEMESMNSGGLYNTGGIGGINGIGGVGGVSGIGGVGGVNGIGGVGGVNEIGGVGGVNGIGGIGGVNGIGGVGGYGSGLSTSSFSETELETSSMSMGGSSIGGFGSMQESSYMSESESATTMVSGGGGGLLGGGSTMVSEYEMESESSSMVQASSGGGFGGSSYYSEQEMEIEAFSETSSNVMVC